MKKELLSRRSALYLSLATLTGSAVIYGNTKFFNQKSQLKAANNDLRSFDVAGTHSLKQRAKAKNLIYGAFHSVEPKNFSSDLQLQKTFIEECDLLVGGFFSSGISRQEGVFDFIITDSLAEFASQNQMLFRGHPLVWYDHNAAWVVDKFKNPNTSAKEIENILVNQVSTIVKHYAGRIHSWDVVNEAINIEDGRADGLRDNLVSAIRGEKYPTWFNFLGVNFIDIAFHVAAQNDPKAILTYNEQILFYDRPEDKAKQNSVLQLLQGLKSRGVPIHALGLQSHLEGDKNHLFNREGFRTFLQDVANLGLKIIVTELDIADRDLPPDINIRDREVAAAYEDYLDIALEQPATIAVINWGLSDRDTWLLNHVPRQDSLPARSLPFDDRFNRKLAWNAIARAFDRAPKR